MTQPTPYTKAFDFGGFAAANPSTPRLPGPEIDTELNAVKASLNAAIANIGKIQRDDGALSNKSVSLDQLGDAALALLTGGAFRVRGVWAPTTVYAAGDLFTSGGLIYLAVSTHTSAAVITTDIAAGRVAGPIFAGGSSSGSLVGTTSISPSGDTSGTTDTAAIQTAIASGLNIQLAPGIFYTNAALNVVTYASCGQTIRGSGSYYNPSSSGFSTTPPPNTTVIKPTAAVTKAFVVDGTPIGGLATTWVQGFGIENLAIDMANMTDLATNAAIQQIQAWDCHYHSVRVMNDGANKRAWLFSAGAFTSMMQNTQGNILEFSGNSPSFGVTTINILNHDGGKVISNYAGDMRFIGGAFQGAGTKFFLRNSFDVWLNTDVEGSGIFLDVNSSVNFLHSSCELQGFSGTYMSGTPGNSSHLWDQQVSFNTYPVNFTSGYLMLNNAGTGNNFNRSSFLSGASNQQQYIYIGRASGESIWGVAAAINDFFGGTAAGDTVFGSNNASEATWIMAAGVPAAKATATGFYTFGTGTLTQAIVNVSGSVNTATETVRPAADGQSVTWMNAAGTVYALASSNATVGNSAFAIGNGANITGYSDNFGTLTFNINAGNGFCQFQGFTLVPSVDGVVWVVDNHAGANVFAITTATAAGNSVTAITGQLTVSGYIAGSMGNNLTAIGTTQATGLQLTKQTSNITTAAAGTGVVLPATASVGVGGWVMIFNGGANAIKVYGNGSETVDGAAGATGVTLTNAKRCMFYVTAAGVWISAQMGVASA